MEAKNQHKLRNIWNTNAMFAVSGYSQQAADLLPRISNEGFPTAIINFYGSVGGKFMLGDIVNYPIMNHVFGSDAMVHHGKDFKADVTFTLQDIFALNPQDLMQVNRWIPWVPVDAEPIPKITANQLRYAYKIIAMSKFGQREMQRVGYASTYIPHTVNTAIFHPMDKKERKKAIKLDPNLFVVGMVGANKENPPRKNFQEAMDAFKMFHEKVTNSVLYVHTSPEQQGGFPLREYAKFIGIEPFVAFPDPYIKDFNTTKESMNLIYNTFDMLLEPSLSEGFGIPIIEAQACGVPVVVNNWTSMPELIRKGITGEVCDLIPGPNGKRFTGMGSYGAIPHTPSLSSKMMNIYGWNKEKTSAACRNWIVENFDLETTFKTKWAPFLEKLESEIYPPLQEEQKVIQSTE